MKICVVDKLYRSLINKKVQVNGWVLSVRKQKSDVFIKLNDGSNSKGIQLVLNFSNSNITNITNITIGTSIKATGLLVESPSPKQPYEINISNINDLYILGKTDQSYPLSKTKLSLEYLRNHAHLRFRTSSLGSIFRIKSSISHATHIFFQKHHFFHINPNIITINECEGGAGVFHLTEHPITNHSNLPENKENKEHDWNSDHFGRPSYLTVSSQLQLEAIACSMGSVYTTNKSFRSEHSNTHKHLSEFEHLEIEDTFNTLEDLMELGEDYIKYVSKYLLTNCPDDIDNLGNFISKGLRQRIETVMNNKFHRITYDEAIDILNNFKNLSKEVKYGEDLCSEFENAIVEHFNGPVFIYNWPSSIKSFYMKQIDNGKCSNFDLIMPYHVGELIGGSMREDNLEVLLNMMKQKDVSPEPLSFYTDLRKYGSVPHGGFGLGLDRLCMLFTGIENIKDVVAFPVYYKHCEF
jgi:asparaginyl-tRNA synthetase